MAYSIPRGLGSRFTTFLHTFAQGPGLPFRSALTAEQIEQAAAEEGVNFGTDSRCVWTVPITLWAFVGQFLQGARTCVAAVNEVMNLLQAMGREACSAGTSAFCKARKKLPEKFLSRLTYQVGDGVEDEAPEHWRWHKGESRTLLLDGFDITLDDTPDNQAEYPQPSSQRPGVGFPKVRGVVLLAFATAVVVGAAFGRYAGKQTGETALFRQLFPRLRRGDIVVADRYYCSYFMIALLQQRGAQAVFRLHQKRDYDFRRGEPLGHNDHVVVWHRPERPDWMDEATYATIPETLIIREVRFRIEDRGCRSREIVVATTLLNHHDYSRDDIADGYHQRWHAELDIRAIKQTLGMDMIHCKTPDMSRKALWAHLLGYNLVRQVAAQAAREHDLAPRQISFASAKQILDRSRSHLIAAESGERESLYRNLFKAIATHKVGNRPNRVEPRRVKRRRDKYPNLRMPRAQARAAACAGRD